MVVVCGSKRYYTDHCHDRMSLRHRKMHMMLLTVSFSVSLCPYWCGGKGWWCVNGSALSGEIVVLLIGIPDLLECILGGRAEGLNKHRLILPWINLAAFSRL